MGEEGPGGFAPWTNPKTGAHGGGGLYRGQRPGRHCRLRSIGTYAIGAAAPWAARIGITPQALGMGALYRLGPPGPVGAVPLKYQGSRGNCPWGDDPARPRGSPADRRPQGRPYIVGPKLWDSIPLPRKRESSFPPLGLLSPRRPLLGSPGAPIGFTSRPPHEASGFGDKRRTTSAPRTRLRHPAGRPLSRTPRRPPRSWT